ncbi:hypothetical protein Scep_014005 [Stephania cephalantha]|uniref:Uncharacterized protein n=1 Tax=Stephania cephalantha TaxID=152367 RepID=A0AAP0J0G9_9MAGN
MVAGDESYGKRAITTADNKARTVKRRERWLAMQRWASEETNVQGSSQMCIRVEAVTPARCGGASTLAPARACEADRSIPDGHSSSGQRGVAPKRLDDVMDCSRRRRNV